MTNERKVYRAKFNKYDFTEGNKKIWFKDVINAEVRLDDAYIDRDDAVFLIGNLAYEEMIEFIGNIYLDEDNNFRILSPKDIRKIETISEKM